MGTATLAPPEAPAATMDKFVIEGGVPLSGTIVPAGNKNAALPVLAACLLTEEEVVLRNIPRIRDVDAMIELLRGLGVASFAQFLALAADGGEGAVVDFGNGQRLLLQGVPEAKLGAADVLFG